jgi:hypothetical protein
MKYVGVQSVLIILMTMGRGCAPFVNGRVARLLSAPGWCFSRPYITWKIVSILLSNRVPSPTPKTPWTRSKTLSTR